MLRYWKFQMGKLYIAMYTYAPFIAGTFGRCQWYFIHWSLSEKWVNSCNISLVDRPQQQVNKQHLHIKKYPSIYDPYLSAILRSWQMTEIPPMAMECTK